MLHAWICWSVRPPDPERQTKRRVRNIGAARVRPSFFRQRTNRKEGRKAGTGTAAAKQQRQGARGLERSLPRSTTGRCERAELSRGPSLPPSGLVLCPSVAVRPEWHADIRTARRAAVKQSGKREWQAGRGNRHDGRRRQRHYRRNRRGSTGSRSNRARRGNCWDKTLLG